MSLCPSAKESHDSQAVAAYLASKGWATADPFYAATLNYFTIHARLDSKTGQVQWDKKYYNYAADFISRSRAIEQALAGRPAAFRAAWLAFYAKRLISYRIDYDMTQVLNQLAAFPDGDYVPITDTNSLSTELEQRYQWSTLGAEEQIQLAAGLGGINASLKAAGGISGPILGHDNRLLAGDDQWRIAYDVVADSELLFPDKTWLVTQNIFKPSIPSFVVESSPVQQQWLTLKAAGPEGKDVGLRLDMREGEVISAAAIVDNRSYPVIPLSRNDSFKPVHTIDENFPDRWLRIEDNRLRGCARIVYAWESAVKYRMP